MTSKEKIEKLMDAANFVQILSQETPMTTAQEVAAHQAGSALTYLAMSLEEPETDKAHELLEKGRLDNV
jgi:hypothetical protein